jgi:hypothetical protein
LNVRGVVLAQSRSASVGAPPHLVVVHVDRGPSSHDHRVDAVNFPPKDVAHVPVHPLHEGDDGHQKGDAHRRRQQEEERPQRLGAQRTPGFGKRRS